MMMMMMMMIPVFVILDSEANPASLDAGVVSRLPSSLDQSVAALEGNKALQEALGPSLVKTIIAIRKVCAFLLISTFV
jgi:glutamine synthetase